MSKAALGDDHLYPLAGTLDSSNAAKNSVHRNGAVAVRSRVPAGYDASLGRSALQTDHPVYHRGIVAAVIKDYVALFDGLVGDWNDGDYVAVFDGGTHAGAAHTKLDRKAT